MRERIVGEKEGFIFSGGIVAVWEEGGAVRGQGFAIVAAMPDGSPSKPLEIRCEEGDNRHALIALRVGSLYVAANQRMENGYEPEESVSIWQIAEIMTGQVRIAYLGGLSHTRNGKWAWDFEGEHYEDDNVTVPLWLKPVIDAARAKARCLGCHKPHYIQA